MKVHSEEINDAEPNSEELIKINERLDNDFVSCVKKRNLKRTTK